MSIIARLGMSTGIAKRFVAGTTLQEAVKAVRALNKKGLKASVDALGENVKNRQEALKAVNTYAKLLEAIHRHRLRSGISVKLTMLGLDIDTDFTYENLRRVVRKARPYGIFVRIDMESSAYTQRTLDIFYRISQDYSNVGIVLQAMLYRSKQDTRRAVLAHASVRLVKGAYHEPRTVAYEKKEDVNLAYRTLLKELLKGKAHVAIATHDEHLIAEAKRLVGLWNIPKERYEFQMLYGIRKDLQKTLVEQGYPVRVYVPFGENYIPYFMRRLRERKENLYFLMRHLLK